MKPHSFSAPAVLLLAIALTACTRGTKVAESPNLESLRPSVEKLRTQIQSESAVHGHAVLGELCTSIGPRPCGSPTPR
jgi:hypothetical protein